MRQLPLPVRLRTSSVFASYFAGVNSLSVRQLVDLAPGVRPPVVWIYGHQGVGKTHLLQAICAQAGSNDQAATYWPLRESAAFDAELLIGCESLAFVCLDDLEAIAGDDAWERAIFRLYTEIEDRGGRIVVAASVPPSSLPIKLRDLASRLAAGAVLRLQALTDDEQIAALGLRAKQMGLELPNEVAQFLLRHLPRDMTSLCGALDALDQASLVTQRRLTVPFVRNVIGAIEQENRRP